MPDHQNAPGLNGSRGKNLFARTVWPPLIWLALIWLVSSLPGKSLPAPRLLSLDKLAHIGVYLVLGLLTNRAVIRVGWSSQNLGWIYLALLVSSGLDEWHQHLIPQRSVSVWDFAANAAGLVLAFGAYWIFRDRS